MDVRFHPGAEAERSALAPKERVALDHAIEKLGALGIKLGFPHSSKVVGADNLRELRPRAGRSPIRPLYRRLGETFVIAAIGPEAQSDPTGYKRSIRIAEQRLAAIER
ncbi:MAG: hypothetical protein DMF98_28535 [Acidobacteria bacterium]|nr:MAG: hypothetical protein DMF98_28535 [Acidobacteriota bacterium]